MSNHFHLLDVAYGSGLFVAVVWNGVILTSENGVIWTRPNSETSSHLRGVIVRAAPFLAAQQTHDEAPVGKK